MANIAEMVRELQQERDRLNKAIAALSPLAGTNRTLSARGGSSGPRRTLSAAARKKVSLAQKARWAKLRAENSAKGLPLGYLSSMSQETPHGFLPENR